MPVSTPGSEHSIDLINRKSLGIKIVADPVEHLLMPFMVRVVEHLDEVIESRNASTIFRWTREPTIRANRICCVRITEKPFFQDYAVLPAVAKIVCVNNLGASPA